LPEDTFATVAGVFDYDPRMLQQPDHRALLAKVRVKAIVPMQVRYCDSYLLRPLPLADTGGTGGTVASSLRHSILLPLLRCGIVITPHCNCQRCNCQSVTVRVTTFRPVD
jgi:hypothetical protein